jgi:hypothetical protein
MKRAVVLLLTGLLAGLLTACGGHSTARQPGVTDQQVSQMEKLVNDADSTAGQADREAAADR